MAQGTQLSTLVMTYGAGVVDAGGWDVQEECICIHSVQFSSVAQLCPTLCDPVNRSMPGLPGHHKYIVNLLCKAIIFQRN